MFNPLKWERVDRARLLFAAAFGFLLIGFANGGSIYFRHLSAQSLSAGRFIVFGFFVGGSRKRVGQTEARRADGLALPRPNELAPGHGDGKLTSFSSRCLKRDNQMR
jgi:hypothetical protein